MSSLDGYVCFFIIKPHVDRKVSASDSGTASHKSRSPSGRAGRCKVFSYAVSCPRQAVNEGKFTPTPGKIIFLTRAQNFLSEVGIFGAFQGIAVSKIFPNCKSLNLTYQMIRFIFYNSIESIICTLPLSYDTINSPCFLMLMSDD